MGDKYVLVNLLLGPGLGRPSIFESTRLIRPFPSDASIALQIHELSFIHIRDHPMRGLNEAPVLLIKSHVFFHLHDVLDMGFSLVAAPRYDSGG